ncbi:MAG: hypothetical protein ACYC2R_09795 [Burkholderiales bacterium]
MKPPRFLAAILIFALAVTPALAADCATSCAGMDASMSLSVADSTAMAAGPCQDMGHGGTQPVSGSPVCQMAAVCHLVSSSAVPSLPQSLPVLASDSIRLPFSPVALSADLVPPSKPPA